MKLVPVKYLLSLVNPLEVDVWGCGPITLEMVNNSDPLAERWNPDDDSQIWTAEQHAGRIKYLALQPKIDPLDLDVGIPDLGYDVQTILDGHHRLVAAVYRGDEMVWCEVQGAVDYIDELIDSYLESEEANGKF